MKTLYQNLYNRIGQIIDPSIFSHFVAMKGSAYDLQKNRIMVIGRATNGWESLDCSSEKACVINLFKSNKQAGIPNAVYWLFALCENRVLPPIFKVNS